jgi:iron complex outermembrane receptor protein
MHIRHPRVFVLSSLLACATAQATTAIDSDLADLSIEQLSNIVITSVSRQEERLNNAAASIYIISANEIRRSGVRSLPEALRLAPNLQISRVDARNYAVTARGFSSPFENKLLVLIDGRSVYSPLFSGVFWDAQDVVMEDIERIEVISGPGATIWGANAVNGVINVITRSSKDTQGGLVSMAGGSEEKDGTVRYGGTLPNGGHYRLYARYFNVDDTHSEAGVNTETGMRRRQAGFRTDLDMLQGGLMMAGDIYHGALGQGGTRDIQISGANLVNRYTRKLANDSELRLQLVLDHTERNQPNNFIERLDTVEVEAQHGGLRLGERNSLVWGGGYRYSQDKVTGIGFGFLPDKMDMHWGNVFVQDEITLAAPLRLTAGVKVEHNNYTGAEYLPSLRLAWTPDARQLVWGSLARTVRAPSRIDRDFYLPAKPVIIAGKPVFLYNGGPNFESETADVAELGYRAQAGANLSFSATLFYSRYDKLRTLEPLPLPRIGLEFQNLGKGTTRGLELWSRWQATSNWRLSGGLVTQGINIGLKPGSRDSNIATGLSTNDPTLHWLLRSSYDISDEHQLDLTLRYQGKLPNPAVPSYHELDLQWLWKPHPNLELALIGQNLLHSEHPEFAAAPTRSVFERTALLKATWRF